MGKVIVVGSFNVDVAVGTERFPRPGETVMGGTLRLGPGGKGANQAIACARLGGQTFFVGRIGDDLLGEMAKNALEQNGMDLSLVGVDQQASTGAALILVSVHGENEIVVAPGANMRLTAEDVRRAEIHLNQDAILLAQLEVSSEAVKAAAELARKHGAYSILNPAPASPEAVQLVPLFNLITPNESEAEIMTGISVTDQDSAGQAAQRLIEMGAGAALITMGAKGSLYLDPLQHLFTPAVPAEAKDTTGAGDAFNGALAFALARGDELSKALKLASVVAAVSVTRQGAGNSMPTLEEAERFTY